MKIKLGIRILLLLATFVVYQNALAHRNPVPRWTESVYLADPTESVATQNFEYKSNEINVVGKVEFNDRTNLFSINGHYSTLQNIDSGVNLAFQIYNASGDLSLRDGSRTSFRDEGGALVADFEYKYDLNDFKLQEGDDKLTVQFNYVKEGAFWADEKFPNIELPALSIENLNRGETFEKLFSWTPYFLPVKIKAYSYNWFHSLRVNTKPFNYRAATQGYYLDEKKITNNKRNALSSDKKESNHFILAEMFFDKIGAIDSRLGFVWDGVRWYKWAPTTFGRSHVIPVWIYSLIALSFLAFLVFIFAISSRLQTTWKRRLGFVLSTILGILFILEFTSSLLPVYLIFFICATLAIKGFKTSYKTYWIVSLFIVSQEAAWSASVPFLNVTTHGLLFSLFLALLIPVPLAFINSRRIKLLVANSTVLCVTVFYFTMVLYFSFFEDFPTLNVLTYATQGVALTDSMASLMEERYSIAIISTILSLVLLNSILLRSRSSADSVS